MLKPSAHLNSKSFIYALAWLAYISFAYIAFPILSLTTMIMSIVLTMLAAWLYGFVGCIVTTIISIPFHYMILVYYCDDPAMWKEAFNPFGISTQLLVSGSIAMIRHTKLKIERLNKQLELKVQERTQELKRLQHYIVQNHETAQILLSHMVLGDLGDALLDMLGKCDVLLNNLVFEENPASSRAEKLREMIKTSFDIVQNLEFIDHFYADQPIEFIDAVRKIADQYTESANIHFDIHFQRNHDQIPKYIQHQLYRITQEAITNAVRHGRASNISVDLNIDGNSYMLSVVNDGNPMPAKIESGLGLKLMQHRTQQLGGSLHWKTTTDGRTEIDCRIPQPHD